MEQLGRSGRVTGEYAPLELSAARGSTVNVEGLLRFRPFCTMIRSLSTPALLLSAILRIFVPPFNVRLLVKTNVPKFRFVPGETVEPVTRFTLVAMTDPEPTSVWPLFSVNVLEPLSRIVLADGV